MSSAIILNWPSSKLSKQGFAWPSCSAEPWSRDPRRQRLAGGRRERNCLGCRSRHVVGGGAVDRSRRQPRAGSRPGLLDSHADEGTTLHRHIATAASRRRHVRDNAMSEVTLEKQIDDTERRLEMRRAAGRKACTGGPRRNRQSAAHGIEVGAADRRRRRWRDGFQGRTAARWHCKPGHRAASQRRQQTYQCGGREAQWNTLRSRPLRRLPAWLRARRSLLKRRNCGGCIFPVGHVIKETVIHNKEACNEHNEHVRW